MRLQWPLTGRSEEMRIIDAALADPHSPGVVICGGAGVGKSRLAREFLSSAAAHGLATRWVVGSTSAKALPLGALAAWAGPGGSDTLQQIRRVIEGLTSVAAGAPVIVAVDDVHLIDDLSAFVLNQIVERRAAKVMLTLRTSEPTSAGVAEIWRRGQFERLDVQPLSRDETSNLLQAVLGGIIEPEAAQKLWRLTQGNVLYLRNMVEQELADDRLAARHGVWSWLGDPVVPPGLAELIESRMGDLPGPVADVVDVLAVGEPIELAGLTRMTSPSAVEDADVRGLIAVSPLPGGVEVRLAHPLYGEVRRNRSAPIRLRRLRGRVAAHLAETEDRDDIQVVVRRAALMLDSDVVADVDLLVRAAKGAVWLTDLPLAERLTDAAIRAGGGAEANLIRAHALSWLSRGDDVDTALANIDTTAFSDVDHGKLAFARAANRLFALADPDGARKLIEDAAHATPPPARNCIDAFHTLYWGAMGKPDAMRQFSTNLALDQLPDIVGAGPAMAQTIGFGDAGRIDEAVAAADFGYELVARTLDAAQMRFGIATAHVGALVRAGLIGEACDVADRVRRQAADLPGAAHVLNGAATGLAAFGAGRLREVNAVLDPVIEMLTASGDTNGIDYFYRLPVTIAFAMRGMTDEAAATLAVTEHRRHPGWRCKEFEWELAKAWVAACRGVSSEAIRVAASAAEIARGNGQFAGEVVCLQAATQFGDGSPAARLGELADIVEGPRVKLAAQFADALRDDDGDGLDAVALGLERMGDRVAAADAAAHAALVYRRKGLRGSALRCSTRAGELANQCGASTLVLRKAIEPLPLSDREREIVMLLAEGLSSREIAERLTLSVRTVEGHIYRAMGRTGTTTREELSELLPRRTPEGRT